MEETLLALQQEIILFLPQLVSGLVIFVTFWVASKIARHLILQLGLRTGLVPEVRELTRDVAGLTILAFGVVTALGTLGIDVGAMIAGLGLTGFALGFALQDIVSNTLAGILILMYRPFVVGDRIKVAGHEGSVIDIDLRYTTLSSENNAVLIPNSVLFKEALIVYDQAGRRRRTGIRGA